MSRTFRKLLKPYEEIGVDSNRDKKKFYKPHKKFKKAIVKKEKARARNTIRHIEKGEEVEVPLFKRHATWDWN